FRRSVARALALANAPLMDDRLRGCARPSPSSSRIASRHARAIALNAGRWKRRKPLEPSEGRQVFPEFPSVPRRGRSTRMDEPSFARHTTSKGKTAAVESKVGVLRRKGGSDERVHRVGALGVDEVAGAVDHMQGAARDVFLEVRRVLGWRHL